MSVPVAISKLKLCMAFRGHAVDVMSCITSSSDPQVHIIDDDLNKYSHFTTLEYAEEKGFTGLNPKRKDLHLLSIDNKLLSNIPGGIADCALFHTDIFSIIEFKTNAKGNFDKSVEDTYQTAIRQLEHTIDILQQKMEHVGIDFINMTEIVCHVVVATKFPRNRAMEQNYAIAFANNHYLELSFDNSRTY